LGVVEPAVEDVNLVDELVEPLEQRVELAVVELLSLRHARDSTQPLPRPRLERSADEDPEEHPARIDRDVDRRRVAPADEVLMDLVADRVGDAEQEGGHLAAQGEHGQEAEHRVLRHVWTLANNGAPGSEAGPTVPD